MQHFYAALAAETSALLAPVGELFDTIQLTNPEIDLYWHDGEHASAYGDYLIAAVLSSLLCKTTDLSALDDQAIDFDLDFEGENGMPLAKERASDCVVQLAPEKTAVLRSMAAQCVGEELQ